MLPKNSFEIIFLILGIIIGGLYSLDGWRGSDKDIPLSKTRRLKNFLWVTLAAFSTFFMTLVDENVNRSILFCFYVVGFFVAVTLVVFGWSMVLLIKFHRIKKKEPQNYPEQPFAPVSDYFYYGYGYHCKQYEEALKKQKRKPRMLKNYLENFLPHYRRQLTLSIGAIENYISQPNETTRKFIAQQILKNIQGIVVRHYSDVRELKINANYMRAMSKTEMSDQMKEKIKFAYGDTSRYPTFLSIEHYADPLGTEDFILPVEPKHRGWEKSILPGAPHAFNANHTNVIDDTHSVSFSKDLDLSITEEIKNYFLNKDFRSFASINIISSTGKQVGIMNVESNKEKVFGQTNREKEDLAEMLQPFCALLGCLIKYKEN